MKIISGLLTISLSLTAVSLTACDVVPEKADGRDRYDEWDVEDDEDLEDLEEVEEVEEIGDEGDEVDPVDPDEPRAFALRHGDLPPIDVGGDSGGDSGGGDDWEIDPDSLLVTITNGAATCEQPFAANECGGLWSISFTLPPEQQAPGIYELWPELNGFYGATGEPYPEGDCYWGGGTLEGMVEIYDVDGASVRGRIFDSQAFEIDANVEFSADGC